MGKDPHTLAQILLHTRSLLIDHQKERNLEPSERKTRKQQKMRTKKIGNDLGKKLFTI